MIIEAILLGLLLGKLRGGSFKRMGQSILNLSWVIFFAFSLTLLTSILICLGNSMVIKYRMVFYIISYGLLIIYLFFNIQYRAMWFIILGSLSNFLAIMVNGGSMPIDMSILKEMGFHNLLLSIESGAWLQYIPLEKVNNFTIYLGKIFSTPRGYPLKQIFSLGDILTVIGIFFLIVNMMLSSSYGKTSKVIKFDHRGQIRK